MLYPQLMVVWDQPTARSLRLVPWAIPSLPTTDRRGSVLLVNLESSGRLGLYEPSGTRHSFATE
jgi:hypothetical protein